MQPEPIRLYTDENIDPGLAAALRLRGHDALSCHDAGNANQRLSDEWQTEWAATEGRAILTYNARDFVRIASQWSLTDKTHCGILLIRPQTLGELIRVTHDFLERYSADDVRNVTMWVS